MDDERKIDFETPLSLLELLLNQFDSGRDIPMLFQIGDERPVWEKISASLQLSLDDLEAYAAGDDVFFSASLLGHGFMSNFFHFNFFSPQLKVAVSFPHGMVLADSIARQEHVRNARGVIATLFLLFRAFREGRPRFLPENGLLLVVCQDFNTSLRLKDELGVIREEQSWQGLLDMLSNVDDVQDGTTQIWV